MTDKLIKKKTSLWILLFIPLIIPALLLGFIAGFIWGYLYGAFNSGVDFAAKLSGYETNEEILNRILKEKGL